MITDAAHMHVDMLKFWTVARQIEADCDCFGRDGPCLAKLVLLGSASCCQVQLCICGKASNTMLTTAELLPSVIYICTFLREQLAYASTIVHTEVPLSEV